MDAMNKELWPGWRVVRVIGKGAFGTVYEIQKNNFGNIDVAALKVISIPINEAETEDMLSDNMSYEEISKRYEIYTQELVGEYTTMKKMQDCPNIVRCDDVIYSRHADNIGWDISIKMEKLTPIMKIPVEEFNEGRVIRLARDLCNALVACERHKVLHRDIKPQNIFVSNNGDFKLGDFGIARTAEKTTAGTKTGTIKFMAPEIFNNERYSNKVDIYSLGLTLYWLMNKRRTPFLPLPPESVTYEIETEAKNKRFSGEEFNAPADGSEEFKRVIMKACAFRPEDRYQTASEMLNDLNSLKIPDDQTSLYYPPVDDFEVQIEDVSSDGGFVPESTAIDGTMTAGGTAAYLDGGTKKYKKKYKLIFDADGGETEESERELLNGSTFGLLPTPTRKGYVFDGWYTEKGNRATESDVMGQSALTLRARWRKDEPKTYTITFNANGGSSDESSRKIQADKEYGKLPGASKKGYSFEGWYTSESGGSRVSSDTLMAEEDVNLYAHWKKKSNALLVVIPLLLVAIGVAVFLMTRGRVELPDVIGKSQEEAIAILKEAGFENVRVDKDYDQEIEEDLICRSEPATGKKVKPEKEVVIFVSEGKKPVIVPDVLGKTQQEATEIVTGLNLRVEIEERYSEKTPEGNVISTAPTAGKEVPQGARIKLYVSIGKKPVPVESTVTFDPNGGTVKENTRKVTEGNAYGALPVPTKSNYAFIGWYTDAKEGTEITEESIIGNKDITLYAHWAEIKKFSLSFNANGGSVKESSRQVQQGASYGNLPTPTRSGYTFDGWYTAASGGSKVSKDTKMGGGNVTLYAHWIQIKKYTLTFNANGGSVSESSRQVQQGLAYGTLPTPTRSGYTFSGWYTAASGGTAVSKDTKMGSSNVTVYAHWTAIPKYTLTFNANGGSVSETSRQVQQGAAYGTLPTPTRSNYTFNGWYTAASGGTKVSKDTKMGSANVTLYAHWTEIPVNSYTVSWSAGTGYSISVNRTSSKKGSTGYLSSGAVVYEGDVLAVTYTAATGYTITSKGATSITVSRNITSSDIYCTVSVNSYTYTVNYVSSNGTNLGSSTVTGTWGSSQNVSAPAKTGYNTPAAQTVYFDSTSKTVTFTYTPAGVSTTMTVTGDWWYEGGARKMWYTCVIEIRNRTATTIEYRAKWTNTIRSVSYFGFSQYFKVMCNSASTAIYQIATASDFAEGTTGKERSRSNTTNWITVYNLSPTTTSVSITGIGYWKNQSTERCRFSQNMTIPAY